MSRRCGKTRLVERWLEVSPSGAAIRTFQETLQTALVYGTADMVLVPLRESNP